MTSQRKMQIIGGVLGILVIVSGGLRHMSEHTTPLPEDLPAKAQDELNAALVASANKLHAPRMMDDRTRLDGATVSGHEVTFHYTLLQPPVKSPADIQSTFAKLLCSDVAWREGLAGGAIVHASYTGPDGKHLFDLTMTSDDCK